MGRGCDWSICPSRHSWDWLVGPGRIGYDWLAGTGRERRQLADWSCGTQAVIGW